MDIGINSNLWPEEVHRAEMPRILAEMAQAEYAGIEIGAQRVMDLYSPEVFLGMCAQNGLHISGIHTPIQRYNAGDLDYAKRAADYSQALETKFMLVSGREGTGKTQDEFKATAEILNQVGEICQERGLTYLYHNHWYEIANGAEELHTLCELTDPKLVSLCLDIGWVERAEGASVVDVTTEFLDRIAYFHLKDTKGEKFVSLGAGTVDFPGWLAAIEGKGDFYLTYERDEFLPTALESAISTREYLRTFGL
jgi:sugar phosphate isomerase/epimerase